MALIFQLDHPLHHGSAQTCQRISKGLSMVGMRELVLLVHSGTAETELAVASNGYLPVFLEASVT
ncbi:hypothetical protein [Pseudomonas syringae]|uniref:hypothetical protein n=1 Tax=Pseudomonas syringae TaxID=317 RepID=UPI000A23B3E1|nr:hypothetical protein [Pseudomonas syringae]AYL15839.1 hypothetical protein D9N00_15790 [Pseudomonas syringae pv. actinidiae]OSR49581.1 hypothetical protein BV325_05368 [Pseudomonas syringae pv. actinidiae]OSR66765.1 hypothetical protein BV328_05322 [Pseudomonas syringae pv. actinidiae]